MASRKSLKSESLKIFNFLEPSSDSRCWHSSENLKSFALTCYVSVQRLFRSLCRQDPLGSDSEEEEEAPVTPRVHGAGSASSQPSKPLLLPSFPTTPCSPPPPPPTPGTPPHLSAPQASAVASRLCTRFLPRGTRCLTPLYLLTVELG